MYSNGFVCSVIVGSKIVKEGKCGRVQLPFGSEYKIRLRNKNDRNAVAVITIDGENVSGAGWVVNAKSHVDIERPVATATKFKFVSQDSSEAEQAGKQNDSRQKNGVVEVSWTLEAPKPLPVIRHLPMVPMPQRPRRILDFPQSPWVPERPLRHCDVVWSAPQASMKTIGTTTGPTVRSMSQSSNSGGVFMYTSAEVATPSVDGCTAEGSHSGQTIDWVTTGKLETESTVITLLLVGGVEQIQEESTTAFCPGCGYQHRSTDAKFCGGCGART